MQTTLALLTLATAVLAQVPVGIAPSAGPPPGCVKTLPGEFEIGALRSTSKRSLEARDCAPASTSGALRIKLTDGVMIDNLGRIGSIVANRQFQFDGPPPQAGAIYTGGFSACSNGSLALGGSTVFYQCLSGNFYNLYDQHWADQCEPITIRINTCNGASLPSSAPISMTSSSAPSQTLTSVSITMKSDGEVQIPTSSPSVSASVSSVSSVVSSFSSVISSAMSSISAANSTALPTNGTSITSATLSPTGSTSGSATPTGAPAQSSSVAPNGAISQFASFELPALLAGVAAFALL